ncbi:MAG: PRC-barrel domain-containing protein [Xanthobacteraceae bacterium]
MLRRTCLTMAILIAALLAAAPPTAADDAGSKATPDKTAPANPPNTDKEKNEPPPASITVIGPADAHGVLGREVKSTSGENMGRVVDVIVDRIGMVRAAVIDFGGFLGVGSRKIVVDWQALHFDAIQGKDSTITLELTQAQVKAAPEYKEGAPVVVLGAAGRLTPFRF